MNKIKKLPETLIRLIAAGEVIERPASVVKELLENSLDAGATRIDLEIWAAGRTRIRITDNGEGMTPEDAEQALDRHATSKLRHFDDLQTLLTFGFRGEALPSIAAVSRLELTTRTADAESATSLSLEGGKLLRSAKTGTPRGTTIDVKDLFFNTPARSKFLKKDSTERSYLLRTVQEIALAHPRVAFHVTIEGKAALALAGVDSLRERLADLWGSEMVAHLLPLQFAQGALSVDGFVNNVPHHHSTKTFQYLYINDRPVNQRLLTHALYQAFHEWLPVGRHPLFALFVHLDPALVDVNVHPTKREVRFASERAVYDTLFRRVRALFENRVDVPVLQSSNATTLWPQNSSFGFSSQPSEGASIQELAAAFDLQRPASFLPNATNQSSTSQIPSELKSGLRLLGQFNRLYLLAEQGDDLVLIDQHAAAERVLYERLLKKAHQSSAHSQGLLTPYLWELPSDDAELVGSSLQALTNIGFEIDPFGANAFALKAFPAVFPELKQVKRFLELLIDSLRTESPDGGDEVHHDAVARAACRAAIKANDSLSTPEIHHLLEELAACERPMTCPHGRPTHIRIPAGELHRRFRRT